jgi:DNA-binding transcriptional regulator YiaG
MAVKANETPRIDLLERDLKIMFDEVRRIREENEKLKGGNVSDKLKLENEKLRAKVKYLTDELSHYKDAADFEEKEELAFYIKSQREAMKMSVIEFARLLKLTDTTIRNYEKGKGKLERMQELVIQIRKVRRGK